jgi:DNA-binding response OmpR family regulator
MRILVVEDDAMVRETLGMVLESLEYQVDLAETLEEALAFLRRSWPDALLLDLCLGSMPGERVHSEIFRAFGKAPPTLVLSASHQLERRAKSLVGAHFLAKPYSLEDLTRSIEAVVSEALQRKAA